MKIEIKYDIGDTPYCFVGNRIIRVEITNVVIKLGYPLKETIYKTTTNGEFREEELYDSPEEAIEDLRKRYC